MLRRLPLAPGSRVPWFALAALLSTACATNEREPVDDVAGPESSASVTADGTSGTGGAGGAANDGGGGAGSSAVCDACLAGACADQQGACLADADCACAVDCDEDAACLADCAPSPRLDDLRVCVIERSLDACVGACDAACEACAFDACHAAFAACTAEPECACDLLCGGDGACQTACGASTAFGALQNCIADLDPTVCSGVCS